MSATQTETELLYTLALCHGCGGSGKIDPAEFPGMSRPPTSKYPPDEPRTCHICDGLKVVVMCPWWWRDYAKEEIFQLGEHGGVWDLERLDDVPRFTYGGRQGWVNRPWPRWMWIEEELLMAVLRQAAADGVQLPELPFTLFDWLERNSLAYFARFAGDWPIDLEHLNRGFLRKVRRLLREEPW